MSFKIQNFHQSEQGARTELSFGLVRIYCIQFHHDTFLESKVKKLININDIIITSNSDEIKFNGYNACRTKWLVIV